MSHYLLGARVVDVDALLVAAQPVVAVEVFTDGIQVAQLQVLDAGLSRQILVDTILIRTYPHLSPRVQEDMLRGVVAQCRLVELVVLELAHLMVLHVYHEQSLMVGGSPYPALLVDLYVPRLQFLRHIRDAMGVQIVGQLFVPPFLAAYIYKGVFQRHHPEVALLVDGQLVVLVLQSTIIVHPVVLP